jgi:phosphonate transport system substrate-binding protein
MRHIAGLRTGIICMLHRMSALLSCAGSVFLCASAYAGPLVIGRVYDDPSKAYNEVKPIVDYVAANLGDLGITEGSLIIAKNRQEMIKFLNEGKVDWTTDSVVSSLIYSEKIGADILLRRWAGGVPTYYSVMFTRKDGVINAPKDLKGKKIAFENPGSTSSFYIPVATLMKAGLDLSELSSPKENTPANKVGYTFAHHELTITTWVHRHLVDAGAYHNQNWESPTTNPDAMKKDLKIFYQSKPFPRMVEVVRKDLDPKIKSRLKEILLKAHEDPAAQAALKAYNKTVRFDEFKGEALAELNEARELLKYLTAREIP